MVVGGTATLLAGVWGWHALGTRAARASKTTSLVATAQAAEVSAG
jgi:hypothetical protein